MARGTAGLPKRSIAPPNTSAMQYARGLLDDDIDDNKGLFRWFIPAAPCEASLR